MKKRRQLISCDEATQAKGQHQDPCSDCPWSRCALPGWLGSSTAEQWVEIAHSDALVECHTLLGAQCAGVAIYRANNAKLPRDPRVLRLPRDTLEVFTSPDQFKLHHKE